MYLYLNCITENFAKGLKVKSLVITLCMISTYVPKEK